MSKMCAGVVSSVVSSKVATAANGSMATAHAAVLPVLSPHLTTPIHTHNLKTTQTPRSNSHNTHTFTDTPGSNSGRTPQREQTPHRHSPTETIEKLVTRPRSRPPFHPFPRSRLGRNGARPSGLPLGGRTGTAPARRRPGPAGWGARPRVRRMRIPYMTHLNSTQLNSTPPPPMCPPHFRQALQCTPEGVHTRAEDTVFRSVLWPPLSDLDLPVFAIFSMITARAGRPASHASCRGQSSRSACCPGHSNRRRHTASFWISRDGGSGNQRISQRTSPWYAVGLWPATDCQELQMAPSAAALDKLSLAVQL